MPAGRMKTKTITTCKIDGNYPHVSHQSNKISKTPYSMVIVTNEKENIPISCQTSQNDSYKKEESSKDHDNKEDMGLTCLSLDDCTDSTVLMEQDCLAPFPPSCSEQMTWAPPLDDNYLNTFQMSDGLNSYAYQVCRRDEINVPDGSQNYNCNSLADLSFGDTEGNILFPTLEEEPIEAEDSSWFNLMCHHANLLDLDRIAYFDLETSWLTNPLLFPDLVTEETNKRKNVTLVLDLDETLVHSSLEKCDNADFTFQMTLETTECTVYVRKRPFLLEFLEKVSEMFEIVIFTASKRVYAEKLLDVLDPHNKFFSQRLYRDSCTWIDRRCVKDLTIVEIDLAKVFIIDNTPEVFRFQVNNGIPIESWYEDPTDSALISMLPFLEKLVDVEDVRPFIADNFGAKN